MLCKSSYLQLHHHFDWQSNIRTHSNAGPESRYIH